MPRTANPADIPARLAEAGYQLFNELGYNATGIQQITDRAGVPKGSFYNHFDSKEAFAGVIIQRYAAWVDQAWARCLNDAPAEPVAALRHVFAQFIAHHAHTECKGCLVGNFAAELARSSPTCRDMLAHSLNRWQEHLTVLIERGQATGAFRTDVSATALATFFWDAWEGALLRMKIEQHTQPLTDTVALLTDHLIRR